MGDVCQHVFSVKLQFSIFNEEYLGEGEVGRLGGVEERTMCDALDDPLH